MYETYLLFTRLPSVYLSAGLYIGRPDQVELVCSNCLCLPADLGTPTSEPDNPRGRFASEKVLIEKKDVLYFKKNSL